MNKYALIAMLLIYPVWLTAQERWYSIVRYDDKDFSFLKNDSTDTDFFNPVKYIRLNNSGTAYFTLGGELRQTYQYTDYENWGDIPPQWKDDDGFIWHRAMLHFDVKLNRKWRIFGQLKNTEAVGRSGGPRNTIDKDEFDVNQLFAEYTPYDSIVSVSVRAGRQELNYGWGKLISIREGPNNRQSFDGLVLISKYRNSRADFFYVQNVAVEPYVLDNMRVNEQQLFGSYSSFLANAKTRTFVDAYYIGYTRDNLRLGGITGNDYRNTAGFRISTFKSGFIYDWESAFQFGKYASKNIRAYSIVGMIGYDWQKTPLNPKAILYGGFTSGDKNPEDNVAESFNPMYPRPPFTLAFPLGPTNINSFQAEVSIRPAKNWKTGAGMFALWRNSIRDGLYTPDVSPVRSADSPHKKVADIYYADIECTTRHSAINAQLVYSVPGNYVKDTGNGKGQFYIMLQYAFKF